MLNSRDVSLLRPDVAAGCREWLRLCEGAGLPVLVTGTVRDGEYQAWLYAQGRTRSGAIVTNGKVPTFHGERFGLAFDFCRNVRGHEYDDPAFFRRAAEIAKGLGFTWGGDWESFPDSPHLQWDGGGRYTGSDLLAGRTPPPMPGREVESMEKRYQTALECPEWSWDTIQKLVRKGWLGGDGQGLDLSRDMVRLLVIADRAGAFEK